MSSTLDGRQIEIFVMELQLIFGFALNRDFLFFMFFVCFSNDFDFQRFVVEVIRGFRT